MKWVLGLFVVFGAFPVAAVPIDPNAENGIAAVFGLGLGNAQVLNTEGEVWILSEGGTWYSPDEEQYPPPPIPVSQISHWSPRVVISTAGVAFYYVWDGNVGVWHSGSPPPWMPISVESRSLGEVKRKYR